jgi:hypothetical protein
MVQAITLILLRVMSYRLSLRSVLMPLKIMTKRLSFGVLVKLVESFFMSKMLLVEFYSQPKIMRSRTRLSCREQ